MWLRMVLKCASKQSYVNTPVHICTDCQFVSRPNSKSKPTETRTPEGTVAPLGASLAFLMWHPETIGFPRSDEVGKHLAEVKRAFSGVAQIVISNRVLHRHALWAC